jgi:hypothetical protein
MIDFNTAKDNSHSFLSSNTVSPSIVQEGEENFTFIHLTEDELDNKCENEC